MELRINFTDWIERTEIVNDTFEQYKYTNKKEYKILLRKPGGYGGEFELSAEAKNRNL